MQGLSWNVWRKVFQLQSSRGEWTTLNSQVSPCHLKHVAFYQLVHFCPISLSGQVLQDFLYLYVCLCLSLSLSLSLCISVSLPLFFSLSISLSLSRRWMHHRNNRATKHWKLFYSSMAKYLLFMLFHMIRVSCKRRYRRYEMSWD